MVRRFKIDISGNKMLLRSDNQGHKETFLCEEYTQPLTYLAAAWFVFFLEILWTPRSHVQTPQIKNLSKEETLYPADRRQLFPNVNKNVQGVSISQCPYLTFVIKTKNKKTGFFT